MFRPPTIGFAQPAAVANRPGHQPPCQPDGLHAPIPLTAQAAEIARATAAARQAKQRSRASKPPAPPKPKSPKWPTKPRPAPTPALAPAPAPAVAPPPALAPVPAAPVAPAPTPGPLLAPEPAPGPQQGGGRIMKLGELLVQQCVATFSTSPLQIHADIIFPAPTMVGQVRIRVSSLVRWMKPGQVLPMQVKTPDGRTVRAHYFLLDSRCFKV